MSVPAPVAVRLSSIGHATEDLGKVSSAILNVCPENFPKKLEATRAKGHFGNEITVYRLVTRVPSHARAFLRALGGQLSSTDRRMLIENLDQCLDASGVLHLRFDKQEAECGAMVLGESDPIKAEVAFRMKGSTRGMLMERVRLELLKLLEPSQVD